MITSREEKKLLLTTIIGGLRAGDVPINVANDILACIFVKYLTFGDEIGELLMEIAEEAEEVQNHESKATC